MGCKEILQQDVESTRHDKTQRKREIAIEEGLYGVDKGKSGQGIFAKGEW